jgi:hypothetical protein
VSDRGRVRSLKTGRILRPGISRGYEVVALCAGGVAVTHSVHRLVALAFTPPAAGREHVNHINGSRTDNRAANLEWVTPTENNRHSRVTLGRFTSRLGATYRKHTLARGVAEFLNRS